MDTSRYLRQIKILVNQMENMDEEGRILRYTAIKTLADELEENARDEYQGNGYIFEKIAELLCYTRSMACLDYGNGCSTEQHHSWAMTAISALESPHCFGKD